MKYIGKGLGTIGVWGGAIGLSYVTNFSFPGEGSTMFAILCIVCLIATAVIWEY